MSIDPIIWFFLFGIVAGILRSELRMPSQIYDFVSMLLLLTIGLKGGIELSSDFVYRMISAFGGTENFYRRFYITALSPVGYVRDGKNLNYYDIKGMPEQLDAWMAETMAVQIAAGCDRRVAFSMGQGTNFKQLQAFNERHGFFERVEPLPHPRWVMQYRRKRLDEFIGLYVETLQGAVKDGDR